MKILICGLPGSGKSTLAEPLSVVLDAVWLNADAVRERYDDWDFSPAGRMRQASRMQHLSDGVVSARKVVIADFVAPTAAIREQFKPNYIIWMNTIEEGRYEDTNAMFESVTNANFTCVAWDNTKNIIEIVKHIKMVMNDNE